MLKEVYSFISKLVAFEIKKSPLASTSLICIEFDAEGRVKSNFKCT